MMYNPVDANYIDPKLGNADKQDKIKGLNNEIYFETDNNIIVGCYIFSG